jgi:sterol desaturase/sphingolipid hydroxylase (fatty acid hydroxylase superfamily)
MPDLSSACLFGCLLPFALAVLVAAPFGARREYRRQVWWSPRSRKRARVHAALNVISLEALGVGVLLLVAMSQQIGLGSAAPWLYWLTPSVLILAVVLDLAQRLLDSRERREGERRALSLLAPDDESEGSSN